MERVLVQPQTIEVLVPMERPYVIVQVNVSELPDDYGSLPYTLMVELSPVYDGVGATLGELEAKCIEVGDGLLVYLTEQIAVGLGVGGADV